ncbi:MAG: hypothetical protein KBC81_03905 [Candidatus Pacebacteria bacterium]|nr:hypothetical protein [Candidatus Paceibacterota bacterium]
MNKIITIAILVLTFSFGGFAEASQIVFETSGHTFSVGDTLVLHVYLNTEGASINAVDLGILYPGIFSIKSISKAGSFVQIWLKEPSYTKDAIFLSGGTPGGANSSIATIATITLEAKSVGEGSLGLSPASSVLLNDGSGTSSSLSLKTSRLQVVPRKSGESPKVVGVDLSTKQTKSDFIKPGKFDISIGSDQTVFSGKHFASFNSLDSGSGVDHYQIKEGDSEYVLARSPYLLSDQDLHSVIRVRAYDGAGNYRETIYPGIFKRIWWTILKLFRH